MTIRGTAFLWHQIRCIVAVLFLVGRRLEEVDIVAKLLDHKNHSLGGKPIYQMASDLPLVLWDCQYDGVEFTFLPGI